MDENRPGAAGIIGVDLRAIVTAPDIRKRFSAPGAIPPGNTPAEFRRLIENDRQHYAKLIEEMHITIQ